jgi:hypothetical protein
MINLTFWTSYVSMLVLMRQVLGLDDLSIDRIVFTTTVMIGAGAACGYLVRKNLNAPYQRATPRWLKRR